MKESEVLSGLLSQALVSEKAADQAAAAQHEADVLKELALAHSKELARMKEANRVGILEKAGPAASVEAAPAPAGTTACVEAAPSSSGSLRERMYRLLKERGACSRLQLMKGLGIADVKMSRYLGRAPYPIIRQKDGTYIAADGPTLPNTMEPGQPVPRSYSPRSRQGETLMKRVVDYTTGKGAGQPITHHDLARILNANPHSISSTLSQWASCTAQVVRGVDANGKRTYCYPKAVTSP